MQTDGNAGSREGIEAASVASNRPHSLGFSRGPSKNPTVSAILQFADFLEFSQNRGEHGALCQEWRDRADPFRKLFALLDAVIPVTFSGCVSGSAPLPRSDVRPESPFNAP
jgi:hypothetical protein